MFQNSFLNDPKAFLDGLMAKKGWTLDTPLVKREYFGQWCRSEEHQVYLYSRGRNRIDDAPKNLTYVIGCDVGWTDAKSIAVLGFDPNQSKKIYIVEKFEKSNLLISDYGVKLKQMSEKYNPMCIVMDSGGGGADIAAEVNARHILAIKPAKKTSKYDYIEFLNADFVAGNILNVVDSEDDPLEIEYENHLWKDKIKRVEGDTDNHIADAVLYAYRECFAYTHEEVIVKPLTKEEHLYNVARDMERQVMEQQELARQQQEDDEAWL
jgi:hypothetical protein